MSDTRPMVSVIVRTMACARRAQLLQRALDSILHGQDGLAIPIVVANGTQFDNDLLDQLSRRRDIEFVYRREADIRAAMVVGRQLVSTPYFAFLDDDDELLPGAIPMRLAPMQGDPAIDLVVTNGYSDNGSYELLQYPDFGRFAEDPLRSLFDVPWLQSINALYRTSAVTEAELVSVPDFFEWTYLAFRLAPTRNIRFLDRPTYRLNRRNEDSLSYSLDYLLGQPSALRAALALDLPPDVKKMLRAKISASLHHISAVSRERGDYGLAWRSHFSSLFIGDGWRWFPYTRRLFT